MQMIKLEDLVGDILVNVPSCPSILAERALLSAVRDWYQDTHCWVEQLAEINGFADVKTYALNARECTTVLAVNSVTVNGRLLDVDFIPPAITVRNALKDNDKLIVSVALSLMPNAQSVLCSHQKYIDKWIEGAMWHLLKMPNQLWSNLEQAEYHRTLFRRAIAHERGEIFNQRQYGSLRVRPRSFI